MTVTNSLETRTFIVWYTHPKLCWIYKFYRNIEVTMSHVRMKIEENRRNVLIHVKQTDEMATLLEGDIENFRLVDHGNGANDESVNKVTCAIKDIKGLSVRLKFVAVRSETVYTKMKDAYLAMQDVNAQLVQVMRKPDTSSKVIFITPFHTLASNLQQSVIALITAVDAISNSEMPNPSILCVQYQLGLAHLYGLEGKPINHAAAVECFKKAADQGNTEAMLCLARCYLNGQGTLRNEQKGLEWIVKSANSNICPHAQNELAMLIITNIKESNPMCVKEYCATLIDDNSVARSLRRGQGDAYVPRDSNEYGVEDAIKLLLSAASEGCADAKSSLGAVYEEAGDLEQAAVW